MKAFIDATEQEIPRPKNDIRRKSHVEHAIGRMKKFGVIGGTFRNQINRYDNMTSIVGGLVNFRTMLNEGFDLCEFVG